MTSNYLAILLRSNRGPKCWDIIKMRLTFQCSIRLAEGPTAPNPKNQKEESYGARKQIKQGGGVNRNAEWDDAIRFYRANLAHIVKRDERNVCSTAMRRLWHPLAEQGGSPKTRSTCRWPVRALGSASSPDSER